MGHPAAVGGQTDIAASVLPGGFRVITPGAWAEQSEPSREPTVQSLAEFAGSAASRAKPSGEQGEAGNVKWVLREGSWVPVPAAGTGPQTEDRERKAEDGRPKMDVSPAAPGPAPKPPEGQGEWIFQNGRWVQTRTGRTESAKPPLEAAPVGTTLPAEFEPEQPGPGRLIRIPADRLRAGDPRYNVIIKPGDVIHVPADVVGEFCITGNVVHGGYISMTGRPMTLKQAIAAAGGLTPLAWPRYCEVIRRIGPKKEEIVMVDLDKISRGEQPDFFIKPNDLINVGTHPSAQWRAGMRSVEKPAYGFAFVYDRNFSEADYGIRQQGGS
jgi:polysaccharide export outer membrane protein